MKVTTPSLHPWGDRSPRRVRLTRRDVFQICFVVRGADISEIAGLAAIMFHASFADNLRVGGFSRRSLAL